VKHQRQQENFIFFGSFFEKNIMKEIIIVETTQPQKLKRFLQQENFNYKVYQEPKHSQKSDIFANYGKAIKNKKRNEELAL
jgi:hypothetical protein